MLQFRPFGSNGPFYSPERDIAYIGDQIILSAINAVQYYKDRQDLSFLSFLKVNEILDKDMDFALEKLKEFIEICFKSDNASFIRNVENSDFMRNVDFAARTLLMSYIGQAFIYVWLDAIKQAHLADGGQKTIEETKERIDQIISRKMIPWLSKIKNSIESIFVGLNNMINKRLQDDKAQEIANENLRN
jgi:hypothetical protein